MPSPIVHIEVLRGVCERLQIVWDEYLLLGVISPDAIHMRPNQTWADKAITHFYQASEESYELAMSQARLVLNGLDSSFKTGYLIHLYTDYFWRDQIYAPYFHREKNQRAREELYARYYHDLAIIDQCILKEASWQDEVRSQLQKPMAMFNFSLLTNDEIMKWKDKVLTNDLRNTCNKAEASFLALSLDEVSAFLEGIIDEIVNLIED